MTDQNRYDDRLRESRAVPTAIVLLGVLDILLILILMRGGHDPFSVFFVVLYGPFVLAAEFVAVLLIGVASRWYRRRSAEASR